MHVMNCYVFVMYEMYNFIYIYLFYMFPLVAHRFGAVVGVSFVCFNQFWLLLLYRVIE